MRISVQVQKKVKGDEEFSSNAFHVGIESEPPPEVAQDREKLKQYVEALFDEARARVDDQIAVGRPPQESSSAPVGSAPRPSASPTRRPPGRPSASPAAVRSNGHERRSDGAPEASVKQLNFLKALGAQQGLSYGQIAAMAQETFGKRDLRDLTKKEASALIDQLRSSEAA